jgi:hypothetical protein
MTFGPRIVRLAMTTIPAGFAGIGMERNHSVLFGIGEPTLAYRER